MDNFDLTQAEDFYTPAEFAPFDFANEPAEADELYRGQHEVYRPAREGTVRAEWLPGVTFVNTSKE